MESVIRSDRDYYLCYTREKEALFQGKMIRRFWDEELPDMYMHNFTAICDWGTDAEDLWAEETRLARKEKKDYFNLFTWGSKPESVPVIKDVDAEASHYVYMKGTPAAHTDKVNLHTAAVVVRASSPDHFKDYEAFDIAVNGLNFGVDFCRRRSCYKSRVFARNENLSLYLCYVNGQIAGTCEWFYHQGSGLVKIEDFTVDPGQRGAGLGSAMLRQMMADAAAAGAKECYLITEADNISAQRLYERFGFERMSLVHVSWFVKLKPGGERSRGNNYQHII